MNPKRDPKFRGSALRHPKVKIWVGRSSWGSLAFTVLALSSAIALVLGSAWLSMRLIIRPGSVAWLDGWFPVTASEEAQTLSEIRASASATGLVAGEPLFLSTALPTGSPGSQDVILPLFQQTDRCQTAVDGSCAIEELRLYRIQSGQRSRQAPGAVYAMLDRLSINGMTEETALSPLLLSGIVRASSTRRLPLTQLQPMPGKAPIDGLWFTLSGAWQRSSNRIDYGQLLRYDPTLAKLQPILVWTSTEGTPIWQQVTGAAAPELVVNQSVGLEPQFAVYQLRSSPSLQQPISAEPIGLAAVPRLNWSYEKGLMLARNGLWSPALRLLETGKQEAQSSNDWTAAMQAQRDFVALHAKVTVAQADRDWASPTQDISALLIDGRWGTALKRLELAQSQGDDMARLLSADTRSLWQRVDAAIRLWPQQRDILTWGAILLRVRHDRQTAIAWVQKQPQAATARSIPASQTAAKPAIDPQITRILDWWEPPPLPIASPLPSPASVPALPEGTPKSTADSPAASPPGPAEPVVSDPAASPLPPDAPSPESSSPESSSPEAEPPSPTSPDRSPAPLPIAQPGEAQAP